MISPCAPVPSSSTGPPSATSARTSLWALCVSYPRNSTAPMSLRQRRGYTFGDRATADFGALAAHASLLELFIEPLVIDFEALLLPDDFLEPQRKPVRVVEAKRDLARERTGAVLLDPFVIVRDELQAAIHGAAETLLLLIGDLLDQGAALVQLRVDVAHVVGDLKERSGAGTARRCRGGARGESPAASPGEGRTPGHLCRGTPPRRSGMPRSGRGPR